MQFLKGDTILWEHERKFNFKSNCSPIVNQASKPITVTPEGMAAADDLDIEAYACVQYISTYTYNVYGNGLNDQEVLRSNRSEILIFVKFIELHTFHYFKSEIVYSCFCNSVLD